MELERIVVFGASNANGASQLLYYYCSNLLKALYDGNLCVNATDQEIMFDLRAQPRLKEGDPVFNAGIPGATVSELLRQFPNYVLSKNPSKVFIWPGLNDITPPLWMWWEHTKDPSSSIHDRVYQELYGKAIEGCKSIDEALESLSNTIFGYVDSMITLSLQNRVVPVVGTLPPFASVLANFDTPYANYSRIEGTKLIEKVNELIRNQKTGVAVADVHSALVDRATGLQKRQFSYGESQKYSDDTVHLNDEGQMMVVAVLCHVLFKRPVKFLAPSGNEISWGYQT